MLKICLKHDVCQYCLNVQQREQFKWPNTLQRSQMENCRNHLNFSVRKKNIKNKGKLHLHHNKSFQTLFKKQIICSHAKTNSTILIYHTGTSARTGFYCHMKWELFFLELEHIKGLVHTGIKKVPHVHI